MKFVDHLVTFIEVPDEISLCINISGCKIHCPGCHSQYLWEDIGEELTPDALHKMVLENPGISCICLMGGEEQDIVSLIKQCKGWIMDYKVAWYTGKSLSSVNSKVFPYIQYIKVGPYVEDLGGLTEPGTNQRFYSVLFGHVDADLTSKFQGLQNK